MHEMVVGKSICVASSQMALVSVVAKVAGTMEVELDLGAEPVQEELFRMFRNGIASALAVPVKHMAKLAVSETLQDQGRRLLPVSEARWYDVAFEVIIPDSMDADVVVAKANNITRPYTAEAQIFRTVLMGTSGVAKVRQVLPKIPAFKFEDEVAGVATSSTSQAQAEPSVSWVLVVVIVFLGILCMVSSAGAAVMLQRRRAAAAKQDDVAGLREAADHNCVVVRIPSRTLLEPGSGGEEALKKQDSDESFEI
jgi:hypothetical protein